MLRWGLTLHQWRSLPPEDEAWYLAHDTYFAGELAQISHALTHSKDRDGEEQNYMTAETVLTLRLATLGVSG